MAVPVLPALAAASDPRLPGLAAALSARPPGTADEDDCRVRHVAWLPGRHCSVVQEINAPDRTTEFVVYEVTPHGMTVRRSVDDPALPGLTEAMSAIRVADRFARSRGIPVRGCRARPVGYRPGARAVVAYDIRTATGEDRLFAKLLADGCGRYAATAAALAASARQRSAPAPIPEVVALWPDLGAVVQRAAPGPVLSAVLRDESVPERERLGQAERLGRLLAQVHATPAADHPRWSAEDEVAALETLLAPAWHAAPATGRSLAALVDRLADTSPADVDQVLSHGAFRSGQVIVDDGGLSLLDLDTASRSGAARDAGNALAYLSWAEIRAALRPGLGPALQEAFLAGYAHGRAAVDGHALAWWSAAAMAKIAGRRFRALARTEWQHVPALLDRAAAQLSATGSRPAAHLGVGAWLTPPGADRMTEILGEAASAPAGLRVLAAGPLAEAPGRRTVVRYEVAGLDPARTVGLIGKCYARRHSSSIAYQNLRLLHDEAFAATPDLAVPAPVYHLAALRMVLYREVTGTPLDRFPAAAGALVGALAARWLATLHASETVLARRLDLTHEVGNIVQWAARVAEAAPDARTEAYALADRLGAAAADLPAVPAVPVHKDFHLGHVLAVRDGRHAGDDEAAARPVAVIDLDEARMGDPALDVAHLIAYLDAAPWAGAPAARAAFLTAYGPLPGPAPDARWAFFAAYTGMKIAKQLVTGRGPLCAPSGRPSGAALTATLRKGLSWLAG